MDSETEELIDYLEANSHKFLSSWREKIRISDDDVNKDEVINNGLQMYKLIIKTLVQPIEEKEIKKFAYRVAQERVEANINIGDFVHNVNLGKSEIISNIYQSNVNKDFLAKVYEEINRVFDLFSYYAVSQYTAIKDQVLQEKITFIDQSHQERLTILGQMASTFVHEFRNPLTAVIGFIKLLSNENPNLKYIDIISHELNQLNYKISQFLHVSKKDQVECNESEVAIYGLLTDIIDFLYASILEVDVNISLEIDEELTGRMNKDEIRQVLLNLLINSIDALKQSNEQREIKIYAKKIGNEIVISISNNGPKIPKESIDTIFEPFYTTKEFGTGIGLFVCKKIIEKHGGTISCNSNENVTTFAIALPHNVDE